MFSGSTVAYEWISCSKYTERCREGHLSFKHSVLLSPHCHAPARGGNRLVHTGGLKCGFSGWAPAASHPQVENLSDCVGTSPLQLSTVRVPFHFHYIFPPFLPTAPSLCFACALISRPFSPFTLNTLHPIFGLKDENNLTLFFPSSQLCYSALNGHSHQAGTYFTRPCQDLGWERPSKWKRIGFAPPGKDLMILLRTLKSTRELYFHIYVGTTFTLQFLSCYIHLPFH